MKCGVAVMIFAKLGAFDQSQGNRLALHFNVDGFYAGRAGQCPQRSKRQSQRLTGPGQAAGSTDSASLDLDRVRQLDLPQRVQVHGEEALRRPA